MKNNSVSKFLAASLLLIPAVAQAQLNQPGTLKPPFTSIGSRAASDQYSCKIVKVPGSFSFTDVTARNAAMADLASTYVVQTKAKLNPDSNRAQKAGRIPKGPNEGIYDLGPSNGYHENVERWTASYAAFEFSGTGVMVEITGIGANTNISSIKVRPEGAVKSADILNGKAYIVFGLDNYRNVNVDINGQMENKSTGDGYGDGDPDFLRDKPIHTICLFANPIYTPPSTGRIFTKAASSNINNVDSMPNLANYDSIIFAPGEHNIGTQYALLSYKTLYIPGDAIVYGTIHPPEIPNCQKGFKIYGSGAISGENLVWDTSKLISTKVFTNNVSDITMQGFVVLDPANHVFNMGYDNGAGNGYKNTYDNLKILAWRINADGLNPFRNTVVTNCFFRVGDDAFYYGNNVQMDNNVTWHDSNGAIMYLAAGDDDTGIDAERSYFRNTTAIYARSKSTGLNGGQGVSMRDMERAVVNVRIRNFTIEDPKPASAFFLAEGKSALGGPWLHNNIIIENVTQNAKGVQQPNIRVSAAGGGPQKMNGIQFINCNYAGKLLSSKTDTFPSTSTAIFTNGVNIDLNNYIQFSGGTTTPSVTVAATTANAAEPSTHGLLTFTRTGSTTSSLTVNYTVSGTATSGTDYATLGTTVTFAAGSATATKAVTVTDDTSVESAETVIVTLATGSGYTVGTTNTATVTIADNDSVATPSVSVTATNAAEGGANGVFTFSRIGNTTTALIVSFTVSGTATSGSDYTSFGTTVTFAAGSASATANVAVIDDTAAESPETVILTLATGSGYTIGSPSAATVTIADNDSSSGALPYTVNFNGLASGTTSQTTPAWSTTRSVGTIAVASDKLQINGGTSGTVVEGVFTSGVINIASSTVNLSVLVSSGGGVDTGDYIKLYTKVDGGAEILVNSAAGALSATTWTKTGITGSTLQIVIRSSVTATDEFYYVDDISAVVASSGGALPYPWVTADIGSVSAAGSASYTNPTYTVAGSGAGIMGNADACRFVSQGASGDCSIDVQVKTITNTNASAKAGVMIRETTAANAQTVALSMTPTGGIVLEVRASTGSSMTTAATTAGSAPKRLKLSRVGNVFKAEQWDGTTWTQIGSTQNIVMATAVQIGFTTTSAVNGTLCTATFDNVSGTP